MPQLKVGKNPSQDKLKALDLVACILSTPFLIFRIPHSNFPPGRRPLWAGGRIHDTLYHEPCALSREPDYVAKAYNR